MLKNNQEIELILMGLNGITVGCCKVMLKFILPCVHRYAGLIEISTTHFLHQTNTFTEGVAVCQNHDLQMLRLFEAFSECAPQLILMMTLILQRGELEIFTGLFQIQIFLSFVAYFLYVVPPTRIKLISNRIIPNFKI